ncbi:peptide chain release factor N(5)-glutamine methyltransferase [Tsukamurella sp. 8F]|uniref:peptide chain release factor N(5)-glutamine methyltransferase n=1 Tax=unclassified Tsukamurella TaxID=2633480 RepID=UPI0023B8C83B|nr:MULTISPECIES: peptide chain release factor N(5)-glutamine methyltransferase [unclassified Tsukamurella]MDF0530316.1 peptide chain release factor N(5)-glutamine methyltransferase [Tsukamurella sp. 8J]MDF0587613.1 peptide chain release factor N(5)-glutamine methyltransferase [Tsukamurella sp. 8F]
MTAGGRPTRLLADAAARLADADVPSPRVDAELLLAYVLGVHRGRLAAADDATAEQAAEYAALVDRRSAREPLQHLTGRAPFGGLELRVGPGVFVPRPETELLAEWARRRTPDGGRIVDLCAGSGALAIQLATTVSGATAVAVERGQEALKYLHANVSELGAGRVQVIAADVTEPGLPARIADLLGGRADVVVCNPPYVPDGAALAPEAAADPVEALFSGPDGLDLIREIGPVIAAIAVPGAPVAVEHDDANADGVMTALTAAGFTGLRRHLDLAGRPRFVTGNTPR